jgi:hypothetical protein
MESCPTATAAASDSTNPPTVTVAVPSSIKCTDCQSPRCVLVMDTEEDRFGHGPKLVRRSVRYVKVRVISVYD